MEDPGGAPDEDSSSEAARREKLPPQVTIISEHGDVVLDVTFQNSKETIRSARKAAQPRPSSLRDAQQPPPQARVRLAFRVNLAVLRRQSKYFDKLLGDSRFKEANDIADAFASLSVKNVKPRDADVADLPWIEIHDDDIATSHAYRDAAFSDLLRILHGLDAKTAQAQITMAFVTTLAVLADRFDCTAAVSKYVATGLKFKWPVTSRKPIREDGNSSGGMSRVNENVLRQKILVAWLLNQPMKFQAATKELIMSGSCRWSAFGEDGGDDTANATWWHLQDGLEEELQVRRASILNTLASIPRHFLTLYTTSRQCKLGYDSSVSCDSYQLGEMIKFLTNKSLLYLVDFSPSSLDAIADTALLPIDSILATLRQCPAYQIDKNHTNCGLRTRMLPILDFVQGLLSSNIVPLSHAGGKGIRAAQAWMPDGEARGDDDRPFRFTRSLAGDHRLRFEHAMGAEKFARDVFTATSWDWTAEDQGPDHISTTTKWSFR
ncbi:hypothetical protein GGS21DRAFT_301783 [Xylaria nigripes]|nr:hypothetical protein GGS21DRAFT_301783 [Xylaria nigripes]